jgi:hypothetical protein
MTTKQAQHKAALWFLQGKSVFFVAKQLHMNRSVVDTWKHDVKFLDMMWTLESVLNESSDYKLRELKRQAIVVLQRALKSRVPKEYQWAVSKLFSLPADAICSPSLGRGLLSPETEDQQEFTPEGAPVPVPVETPGADNRKSLMEFLESTRTRVG